MKVGVQIRKTQKAIKYALTERWYAWEDAWKLAQEDPEVDLEARHLHRPIYKPLEVRSCPLDLDDSL